MDASPRKFRFLTRPVLVLLGLAAGLLAAEASLRIAGVGYRRGRVPQPADPGPSTARTILCVGDSFTFGVGAPPGQCYPEQLQRLLDRRHGAGRWRVINDGYPGRDSAQMLQALERRLERVRPSVMIVLAGLNNDWNSLAREGPGEDAALLSRIDRALLRLRLYRFLKLLHRGWRLARRPSAEDSLQEGWSLLRSRQLDAAQAAFQQALAADPGSPRAHEGLGAVRLRRRDGAGALASFQRALALDPRSPSALVGLGRAHHLKGDSDLALSACSRALGAAPGASGAHALIGVIHSERGAWEAAAAAFRAALKGDPGSEESAVGLGKALDRLGRRPEAVAALKAALQADPRSERIFTEMGRLRSEEGRFAELLSSYAAENPSIRGNKAFQRALRLRPSGSAGPDAADQVDRGLERDLRRMHRLAAARGVRLILCSYPEREFPAARRAAEALQVPYVDFGRVFARRFRSRSEFTVPDGHLNAAGYAAMAETLADAVARLTPP